MERPVDRPTTPPMRQLSCVIPFDSVIPRSSSPSSSSHIHARVADVLPSGARIIDPHSRMFSQKQLDSFGGALSRKRISQRSFDEQVQENIDEFDMTVRIDAGSTKPR